MGVKLGDETRGYTRFRFLSELLVREGFAVDLITSSFQHWEKAQRDRSKECYRNLPYRVVFIDEPGYTKNLDLGTHPQPSPWPQRTCAPTSSARRGTTTSSTPRSRRTTSHACAQNARTSCDIPSLPTSTTCGPRPCAWWWTCPSSATSRSIPFARDAKRVYQPAVGRCGHLRRVRDAPRRKDREEPYPRATVYVGNDLAAFDGGVREPRAEAWISKPDGEVWVTYAGTLGASYDAHACQGGGMRGEAPDAGRREGCRPRARAAARAREGARRRPRSEEARSARRRTRRAGRFPGLHGLRPHGGIPCASDITVNSLVNVGGPEHRHQDRRLPGQRQPHDQHRLEPRIPHEGDVRRLRRERGGRGRARACATPSRSLPARIAAQDHGREGPRRRGERVRPAPSYARSWICCARCCDFVAAARQSGRVASK